MEVVIIKRTLFLPCNEIIVNGILVVSKCTISKPSYAKGEEFSQLVQRSPCSQLNIEFESCLADLRLLFNLICTGILLSFFLFFFFSLL